MAGSNLREQVRPGKSSLLACRSPVQAGQGTALWDVSCPTEASLKGVGDTLIYSAQVPPRPREQEEDSPVAA